MELNVAINYLESRHHSMFTQNDREAVKTVLTALKERLEKEEKKTVRNSETIFLEIREVVTPVQVNRICSCGGRFEIQDQDGITLTLTTYPPQYLHICNKCGKIEHFPKQYPYIEYEIE